MILSECAYQVQIIRSELDHKNNFGLRKAPNSLKPLPRLPIPLWTECKLS